MLQHTVTLQHAATHCSMTRNMPATCLQLFDNDCTLQHASNTLQHTATVSHMNDTHATPSRLIHVPASHWTTLQCTVKNCNTLQRTATNCNTLQHTATHPRDRFIYRSHINDTHNTPSRPIHAPATHCNTQQHTAIQINTLQQTTTHCNAVQHTKTNYNALQQTATHCSALQRTATHCNILEHTHLQLVQTCFGRMQQTATHCITL